MLARMVTALATFAALLIAWSAAAEDPGATLALPSLQRCTDNSHPLLPEMWRGTYLMAPFTRAQLTLADFLYDGSIPAMRVRLYGLKHGSLDLFVKGRTTFLLAQGNASSGDCVDLGDTGLRPLPRDWLAPNAKCEGSAPVSGLAVDWWKSPSAAVPSANWIWYKTAGRSPFRLMFTQPADEPAILGWYTFSYQTNFETLHATDLAALASSCQSKRPHPAGTGRRALQKLVAAMENSPFRAEAEIARLMPELDASCPPAPLPGWPDRARITALMTSPNFTSSPFPTEVLYDWGRKSQRTRMFWPSGARLETEDALLLDGQGYSIERSRGGGLFCSGALPGTLRPNWPETGGCSCEAAIKEKAALAPFGARIVVCPMTAPRVVWSWFELNGRPMVFMETSAPGDQPAGVLTLVDYHGWAPGQVPPSTAFGAPVQCPRASQHATPPASRRCGACHLDSVAAH